MAKFTEKNKLEAVPELLYLQTFESITQFQEVLEHYIDYYNQDRIKEKLNGMSPVITNSFLESRLILMSNILGSLHFRFT